MNVDGDGVDEGRVPQSETGARPVSGPLARPSGSRAMKSNDDQLSSTSRDAPLWINGHAVKGMSSAPVMNPADVAVQVGVVHQASTEQTEAAVRAAADAASRWATTAARERAAVLDAAAAAILSRRDGLAHLLSAEHGKPLREARSELDGAIDILRWHATQAAAIDDVASVDEVRGRLIRRRVPFGVVAVIVPWNYPVLLAQLMAAPALLAGNAVVVKIPDHAPLTLALVLRTIAEHLPSGVLKVVAGSGDDVGEVLTRHPAVRKVAFTGSTPTGRTIMRSASSTLKSISLELGGNDPAIILPGSTLHDGAAAALLIGALTNAGQVCYAPKRLYIHRTQHDAFCENLVREACDWQVGHPDDEANRVGPLNNAAQLRVVEDLLRDSIERGAAVVPLGRKQPGLPNGHWFQPHLVADIPNSAPIVQAEHFGPLIPVVAYDTVDDAVAMANDSEYGLAASAWGEEDAAFDVARRLQAGTVFVNVHRVGASAVDIPFGGFKQSGVGRGQGIEGIHEYTELQIIAQREDMRTAP